MVRHHLVHNNSVVDDAAKQYDMAAVALAVIVITNRAISRRRAHENDTKRCCDTRIWRTR